MLRQQAFLLGYLCKEAAGKKAAAPVVTKHKVFSDDVIQYINNVFLPQADKFNKYGRNPKAAGYDPIYDYGGKGIAGDTAEYRAAYEKLAKQLATAVFSEVKGDPKRFAHRWYGGDASGNKAYWANVNKVLAGKQRPTPDILFQAIRTVETGTLKSPWSRTLEPASRKISSTAYGPYQITGTMVRDYLERFAK